MLVGIPTTSNWELLVVHPGMRTEPTAYAPMTANRELEYRPCSIFGEAMRGTSSGRDSDGPETRVFPAIPKWIRWGAAGAEPDPRLGYG